MHFLYFVKLRKERAATPRAAIREARRELNSQPFCSQDDDFKCDWYVIGGRWSGQLQQAHLGVHFSDEVEKVLPPDMELGYSAAYLKEHGGELQALWKKLGGRGRHPYGRDQYALNGESDDAAPITHEMLARFRNDSWYRGVEVFDAENHNEGWVRDLSENAVGDWLVVIDYHN